MNGALLINPWPQECHFLGTSSQTALSLSHFVKISRRKKMKSKNLGENKNTRIFPYFLLSPLSLACADLVLIYSHPWEASRALAVTTKSGLQRPPNGRRYAGKSPFWRQNLGRWAQIFCYDLVVRWLSTWPSGRSNGRADLNWIQIQILALLGLWI